MDLASMGKEARLAARRLASASSKQKNNALRHIAEALRLQEGSLLAANRRDLDAGEVAGLSAAMLDRLSLKGRLQGMADDILKLAELPDPIGERYDVRTLPNGLELCRQRTPIGVIGVIYESRPNVTIDVAALCIKSGNCAILRGGKEALESNLALAEVTQHALTLADLPDRAVQVIASPSREQVHQMLRLHESIDLIIPRGGAALHQFCLENSRIPVITGGMGICHLFVDATADFDKALAVIANSKTDRPAACNALDTVLVDATIAKEFVPLLIDSLHTQGVTIVVDPRAQAFAGDAIVKLAGPDDWDREWLSLSLGIKIVDSLDAAIAHIADHSMGHSDGILTESKPCAEQFVREVDSSAVFVNASTRFNDGGQFGLGAEVAVSTQKLQARGPMGLRELTSYKWVVQGDYQTR